MVEIAGVSPKMFFFSIAWKTPFTRYRYFFFQALNLRSKAWKLHPKSWNEELFRFERKKYSAKKINSADLKEKVVALKEKIYALKEKNNGFEPSFMQSFS